MSKNLKQKLGKLADDDNNIVVYLIGSARDIVGGRLILIECKRIDKVCQFYEDEGYIDITENGYDLKQYVRFIK